MILSFIPAGKLQNLESSDRGSGTTAQSYNGMWSSYQIGKGLVEHSLDAPEAPAQEMSLSVAPAAE